MYVYNSGWRHNAGGQTNWKTWFVITASCYI